MILSHDEVAKLLNSSWETERPVDILGVPAKALWDEAYEDYVSDNGYISASDHDKFMQDQELYALQHDKCSFVDFAMLRIAENDVQFTDEEKQKLQSAIEDSIADLDSNKLEKDRLKFLYKAWDDDRVVTERELISLVNFVGETKPTNEDWRHVVKSTLTHHKYMLAMCQHLAKSIYEEHEDDIPQLTQRDDETVEEYKARLIAYASTL